MAILFPSAFPPIVTDAIKAVTIREVKNGFHPKWEENAVAIITPADPETIPQISPITSLQNEETLSAFLMNFTAKALPFTFLELIELNGFMSAAVTETPTISKKTPSPIKKKSNNNPIKIFTLGRIASDAKEKTKEIKNAVQEISIIHL